MDLPLERIAVNYTYSRQQVLNKLGKSKYLAPFASGMDKKFYELQKVMNREITQIYVEAYKSTVPIRSEYTKIRDKTSPAGYRVAPRLTLSQNQKIIDAVKRGTPYNTLLSNLIKSSGNPYGGTLRNQHISFALSGHEGTIFVDGRPHVTPYNEGTPAASKSASKIASDLNLGYVVRPPKEPQFPKTSYGMHDPNFPVGKHRSSKTVYYQRSRPSDAAAGFHPETGGTMGWIQAGHLQAQKIIGLYLESISKTVGGISPKEYAKTPQESYNKAKLREYITKEGVPSKRSQDEAKRIFLSEAIQRGAERLKYADYQSAVKGYSEYKQLLGSQPMLNTAINVRLALVKQILGPNQTVEMYNINQLAEQFTAKEKENKAALASFRAFREARKAHVAVSDLFEE